MHSLWLACLLLIAPATLTASDLRIEEVGLQGYYAEAPNPTRIRLTVRNPDAQSKPLELRLQLIAQFGKGLERTDTFVLPLTLGPHEERRLEVPVLVSWTLIGYNYADEMFLAAELRNIAGRLLASDRRKLNYPSFDALVAIVCDTDRVCQEAQTQISFSGNPEEQTLKGRDLKFVAVRQPPTAWWTYASAQTVIFARRGAGLAPEQRAALEGYLRAGGRLVLLEEETADAAFLAPYRRGAPAGASQWVGRGRLLRLPGLRSRTLGELFAGLSLQRLLKQPRYTLRFGNTELDYARGRLATSFDFPSLTWLIVWLGAYILAVGFLNFTLLQRWGRREWGWVTVPVIALVFAGALYAAGTANRPREFTADEVALYWMDDRSPLAAVEIGLRVSSPDRRSLKLIVPGQAVFAGEAAPSPLAFFMDAMGAAGRREELGRYVRLGPPQEIELSLLQWSFQDFDFRDVRPLPGTVRRTERQLRNHTGQNFLEALYVETEKVYLLGALAAGAAVDLAAVKQEPLDQHTGRALFTMSYPGGLSEEGFAERVESPRHHKQEQMVKEWEEWRQLPEQPFQLLELIRGWPTDGGRVFERRSGLFIGLAEESAAGSALAEVAFTRKNYVLTIVSYPKEK